jgi:uncharacterized protein
MWAHGARLLAVLLGALLGAPILGRAQEPPEKIAVAIVEKLIAGQVSQIVAQLSPETAAAVPGPALEQIWDQLTATAGAVRGLGAPRTTRQEDATVTVVPVRFQRTSYDVQVTIRAGRLAGLLILPAGSHAEPWHAPSYVDNAAFSETEVQIGKAPLLLPGTLSLPRGRDRVPAVVLVHGSGPHDRNEAIGPNRPFQDLAQGLASRGIAVLRYEKRTKVYPERFARPQRFTVREETTQDAAAAVGLLLSRADIDARRVVLIGHSLGGTLAPRIAADEPRIAGLVILAGATRPIPELLVEQLEYIGGLSGRPEAQVREANAKLRAEADRARGAKPDDEGPPILYCPPAYWADLNAYDAAAAAASLSLPMLILQGGRDYQVTLQDLSRFKVALAGHANATIRELPKLNHLFMAGEGKSRPEEYDRPSHVDGEVIEAIAAFVTGLFPK